MEQEPGNAAWPLLIAYCRYARLDDTGALDWIKKAARKRYFSLGSREEVKAITDALASIRIPRQEAGLTARAKVVDVGLSMRALTLAKIGAHLADGRQAEGDLRDSAEIRMALVDTGRLMWRTAPELTDGLIGVAVEETGYGWMGGKPSIPFGATEEEQAKIRRKQADLSERAFMAFLGRAGFAQLARRYAHGLDEVDEYERASRKLIGQPGFVGSGGFRTLGIAYSATPLVWVVLATVVGALAVVALIAIIPRRKGERPSSRTIVGVSIAGAAATFCLLALSAIMATLPPYFGGLLDTATGAWPELYLLTSSNVGSGEAHIQALPPSVMYSGIALVVLTAVWATVLILKPRAPRLWRAAFATVCSALAAAFCVGAWLAWAARWRMDAVSLAIHVGFGIVSIGAIFAVWRACGRREGERVGSCLPILATIVIVAAFSVLSLPISTVSNLPWWGILACPAGVMAIAAIVPRVVASVRLPKAERPSYLWILRGGLAVCLAWILVLQCASLIWLGAWRVKAAHDIQRAQAVGENQMVLRIMKESGGVRKSQ
jgi:hypothetical protein